MIALIPLRSGSQRLPGKNTKDFFGHPLWEYTAAVAVQSKVFDAVWLCTDDHTLMPRAHELGLCYFQREPVSHDQQDIVWVTEVLTAMTELDIRPMNFAILRPTSPFRTVEMLQSAYKRFYGYLSSDALRAVQPVSEHPGKMWTWQGQGYDMQPLLDKKHANGTPWHSSPTQSLPPYYVQNASLEMAWTRNVEVFNTIHGKSVVPFVSEGFTGFDINTARDWREAEYLVASGAVVLPTVDVSPHSDTPWAV